MIGGEPCRDAVGEEAFEEAVDVWPLVEGDRVGCSAPMDVEKVGELAFIFSIPILMEIFVEGGVQGVGAITFVEATKIIYIDAY